MKTYYDNSEVYKRDYSSSGTQPYQCPICNKKYQIASLPEYSKKTGGCSVVVKQIPLPDHFTCLEKRPCESCGSYTTEHIEYDSMSVEKMIIIDEISFNT